MPGGIDLTHNVHEGLLDDFAYGSAYKLIRLHISIAFRVCRAYVLQLSVNRVRARLSR